MTDMHERKECDCQDGDARTTGGKPARGEAIARLVKARIPQDHHANFNVRIVPARNLDDLKAVQAQCRPRGHTTGWGAGQATVDPALVAALAAGDKAMVAWLTKDPAHARRFLAEPVAAMAEAGVVLTRAQQKAVARTSEEVAAARNAGAGGNGISVNVQVYPDGRIGAIGTHKPDGTSDDFGCGPKRKG